MARRRLLTKSKYMLGLQCHKRLWIEYYRKDLLKEITPSDQFRFDMGNLVGELATKRYPKGLSVTESDFVKNLAITSQLVNERRIVFEAGFKVGRLYARVDILKPVPDSDEWDVIEVKSGTRVKPENLDDVSFQKYVLEMKGLKVRKCYLMHVNNRYVRDGDLDLQNFLTKTDITKEVSDVSDGINERIEEMIKIIDGDEMPVVPIGEYCDKPYECGAKKYCWKSVPENNVFDLTRGGKKSWSLYREGVVKMKNIPDSFKLNAKQIIQRKTVKNDSVHVNKEKILEWLSELEYPLYYIDFETFNPPIPLFDGVRPYEQVPFQWSVHVQETPGGELKHYEYLAQGNDDPRVDFIEDLMKVIEGKGSLVAYNMSFEKRILSGIAKSFPKYKEWIKETNKRFVDLYDVFKNYYYYDPKQKGSASIKKVLPLFSDLNYNSLEIGDGGSANREFLKKYHPYLFEHSPNKNTIKKLRKHLLTYCGQDTKAMQKILDKLRTI